MADKPVTREEKYLAYLTGDYTGEIPKPITRKEKYLYELCLKGIGGEISPEEIKNAVNEYLEKNPVKPGATAEQVQQIEQNKTDIGSLKEETGSLKEDTVNTKDGLSNKSYIEKAQFEMGYISGDDGEKGNNNINARSKIIHLNIGDKYKIFVEKGNCVLHLYNNGIWQKYLGLSVNFCNEGYGTITVYSSEWDVTIAKECDVCFVVNRNNNAEITNIAQAYDVITISKQYNYKRIDNLKALRRSSLSAD